MRFRFVKDAHFFGLVQRTVDGKAIYVTNREKTLLDAAARPDLSGRIGQLAQALQAAHSDINWTRLDNYLARWGGVVVTRLGYLLSTAAHSRPKNTPRTIAQHALSGHLHIRTGHHKSPLGAEQL